MSKPTLIDSAQIAHQRRPWLVRLLNGPLAGIAPAQIERDDLLRRAHRLTGLNDWGDDGLPEGLEVLVDSINQEAELHPVGRLMTRERLVGVLANRLRVEDYLKRHPEILEQALHPVFMITGLQRTGTTKLQRLLGADPEVNSLLSWEVISPIPINPRRDPKDRIAKAKMAQKALQYINPAFFAIHPVEYDAPEEDVLILDHHFLSTVPEAILNVPSYAAWVEKQDQTPAYEYLRKVLLINQAQKTGKAWVLKSPHHLEWLDVLVKVFPEIKIIHTHRDPIETLPSFCHMVWQGRWIFSHNPDPHRIGRQWQEKIQKMLRHAVQYRTRNRDSRFLDVHYQDLVSEEAQIMERIYHFMDRPIPANLPHRLEENARQHAQYRYGRHRYHLADFGLSVSELRQAYSFYYQFFQITPTQANV